MLDTCKNLEDWGKESSVSSFLWSVNLLLAPTLPLLQYCHISSSSYVLNLGDEHVVLGISSGEVFESLPIKLLLQLHCLPPLLRHQLRGMSSSGIRIEEYFVKEDYSKEYYQDVRMRPGWRAPSRAARSSSTLSWSCPAPRSWSCCRCPVSTGSPASTK